MDRDVVGSGMPMRGDRGKRAGRLGKAARGEARAGDGAGEGASRGGRSGAGLAGYDAVLTGWCVRMALRLGLVTLSERVEVHWNVRMVTTAGRASWPDRLIELNPRLKGLDEAVLQRGDPILRTLRHELAHLVAYERAGRRAIRPHGPEWAAACIELGIPGEPACHLLPFPQRRQKRRYHYTCPACARTLKRVRRMKGRAACYACCQKLADGRFDRRFQLVETRVE